MKNLIVLFGIIAFTINMNAQIHSNSSRLLKEEIEVYEVPEENLQIVLTTCIFEDSTENNLLVIVKRKDNPNALIAEEFSVKKLEAYFNTSCKDARFVYPPDKEGRIDWFFSMPNKKCLHLGANITDIENETGIFELLFHVENLLISRKDLSYYHDCSSSCKGCRLIRIN